MLLPTGELLEVTRASAPNAGKWGGYCYVRLIRHPHWEVFRKGKTYHFCLEESGKLYGGGEKSAAGRCELAYEGEMTRRFPGMLAFISKCVSGYLRELRKSGVCSVDRAEGMEAILALKALRLNYSPQEMIKNGNRIERIEYCREDKSCLVWGSKGVYLVTATATSAANKKMAMEEDLPLSERISLIKQHSTFEALRGAECLG